MKAIPFEALLIFLRYPEAGRVKTRLIPRLGQDGAAELYRRMAEHVLRQARLVGRARLGCAAFVDPPERLEEARRWIGPEWAERRWPVLSQEGGDLGRRLAAAFDWAFASGPRRAVAIGTDCLDATTQVLNGAFDALSSADAVLGPALDGGYYLLGLSRRIPEAFQGIEWSTTGVFDATKRRLAVAGASIRELEVLRDLDTPEDLDALLGRWGRVLGFEGI